MDEFWEFLRETRRCCKEGRLEDYTDWRVVFRQGELLSNMCSVVLARRIDNSCTKARKANARVLGGFGVVKERKEIFWDMCGRLARHKCCNQCRMSKENLKGRRQSRFWRIVQRKVHRYRNESLLLSIWLVAAISSIVCAKDERWSHDNSQSDVLCGTPQ